MLSELAEQAKVFVALTNGKRGNSGVQGDEEEELEVEALALCLFITDGAESPLYSRLALQGRTSCDLPPILHAPLREPQS